MTPKAGFLKGLGRGDHLLPDVGYPISISINKKGGVGKSIFTPHGLGTYSIIHFHRYLGLSLFGIDMDEGNQHLKSLNFKGLMPVEVARVTESKEDNYDVPLLFENLLSQEVITICDTKAASWEAINDVLNTGARDILMESDHPLIFFFISDGGDVSQRQFRDSLRQHGDVIPHILVKNNHFRLANYDEFLSEPTISRARKEKKFAIIELVHLPELPLQLLTDAKIPLALLEEEKNFSIFMKRKLTLYIPQILHEIDKAYAFAFRFIQERKS